MRRRHLSLVLLLAALAGPLAHAHEGHDHDKPAPLNLPVAPRVVAVTPELELVGVASGKDRLTVFLHTFAINNPVEGAQLTVSAGENRVEARPEGPGVFTVAAPWLSHGDADLVFALKLSDGSEDLLTGRLQRMSAANAPVAAAPRSRIARLAAEPGLLLAGLGGVAIGSLAALLMLGRRSRRTAPARDAIVKATTSEATTSDATSVRPLRRTPGAHAIGLIVAMAGYHLASTPARAADAAATALPTVPSTMATDLAQRMPDGTLFVPKATQHLLSVRTMLVGPTETTAATELTGTVVAGPENFGRVQPGQPGRIEAAPGGLAFVGKRVEKGEVLGYVQTYIEASNRANIDSQIAETEARILKNRTILSRYEKSAGAVPQIKVDEVRGELDALVRKRAELVPSVSSREPILAPIGGVVSVAGATIGQIVEARDVLFEIVDPSQFWIEAHGHAHEAGALENITSAFAVIGTRRLPVKFVGRGLALRQQATVYSFKIGGTQNDLSIGLPVKVVVQSATKINGLVVPASAIVRGQTGLPIAWVKTEPERFEPQLVKVEPLDGMNVVVTSGLKTDARIVTDGVTLLNQVR